MRAGIYITRRNGGKHRYALLMTAERLNILAGAKSFGDNRYFRISIMKLVRKSSGVGGRLTNVRYKHGTN